MKYTMLALILSGIILAPGYWAYSQLFSGKSVAVMSMQTLADHSFSSAGFALRKDMFPLAINLTAHGQFLPNQHNWEPPKDRYKASLFLANERIATSSFVLAVEAVANSEPSFKQRLFLLSDYPDADQMGKADFKILIEPEQKPEIVLDGVQLDLRAQASEADGRVLLGGILLLALGVLGLLFA
jgi:hypothetical protein